MEHPLHAESSSVVSPVLGLGLRKRTTPILRSTTSPDLTFGDIGDQVLAARTSRFPPTLLLRSPSLVLDEAAAGNKAIPYRAPSNDNKVDALVNELVVSGMILSPTASALYQSLSRAVSTSDENVPPTPQVRTSRLASLPLSLSVGPLPRSPLPPPVPPKDDNVSETRSDQRIKRIPPPRSTESSVFFHDVGSVLVLRPSLCSEHSVVYNLSSYRSMPSTSTIRTVVQPPRAPKHARRNSATSSLYSRRTSLLSSDHDWSSRPNSTSMARTESNWSTSSYNSLLSSFATLINSSSSVTASQSSHTSQRSLDTQLKYTQKFADKGAPAARKRASKIKYIRSSGSTSSASTFAQQIDPAMAQVWADSDERAEMEAEKKEKMTWYKCVLLLSVVTIFVYGLVGLAISLLTWLRTWSGADVVQIAERDILIFMTLASICCVICSVLGLTGTLLNSRAILSYYNLLLWPTLLAILVVGYTSFKRQHYSLDRKLNQLWSQDLDDLARLRIQNTLRCCGYYNALHDATFSKRCYPRSTLPGCKGKLFRFEKEVLQRCFQAAFCIVPLHLFNIFAAVLCSNHVNNMFGKGFTPPAYRLNITDVRENAMQLLRNMPASAHSHSSYRSTERRRSSISSGFQSLASMPGSSDQGVMGLGLTEDLPRRPG